MPTGPAARRLDPVAHRIPGRLMPGPGSPDVLIGGLPAWRARVDRHECRHGTGVVIDGSPTVLINGQPACRLGDGVIEGRERNRITGGCMSVIIGDRSAAAPLRPPLPSDQPGARESRKADFAVAFEKATGMTIADSQQRYSEATGRRVSQETIELLFTDAEAASRILIKDNDLNHAYRRILNSNVPQHERDALPPAWRKMPFYASIYHSDDYGLNPLAARNSKYVSADGHREVVFDPNGSIIENHVYEGTFNFFPGPEDFKLTPAPKRAGFIERFVHHLDQRQTETRRYLGEFRQHQAADIEPFNKHKDENYF